MRWRARLLCTIRSHPHAHPQDRSVLIPGSLAPTFPPPLSAARTGFVCILHPTATTSWKVSVLTTKVGRYASHTNVSTCPFSRTLISLPSLWRNTFHFDDPVFVKVPNHAQNSHLWSELKWRLNFIADCAAIYNRYPPGGGHNIIVPFLDIRWLVALCAAARVPNLNLRTCVKR